MGVAITLEVVLAANPPARAGFDMRRSPWIVVYAKPRGLFWGEFPADSAEWERDANASFEGATKREGRHRQILESHPAGFEYGEGSLFSGERGL